MEYAADKAQTARKPALVGREQGKPREEREGIKSPDSALRYSISLRHCIPGMYGREDHYGICFDRGR